MTLLETERLTLRRFGTDDAAFLLALLNDPSFMRFVGDRGVRTLDEARDYIADRFLAGAYDRGLGPYLVQLRETATAIGLCSLLKREWLNEVDLGFAFLPDHRSRGYALESAQALMRHAFSVLRLKRLAAISDPENAASLKLLGKLGFEFERMVSGDEDGTELKLFSTDASELDDVRRRNPSEPAQP